MAVPKRKHSKRRTRIRRANDGLKAIAVAKCSNCGASRRPHTACLECGKYKGKQVLKIS
ncbi:MAG: 50S ribosomal protein L32 [Candidatus Dojkabacteria bacterium]